LSLYKSGGRRTTVVVTVSSLGSHILGKELDALSFQLHVQPSITSPSKTHAVPDTPEERTCHLRAGILLGGLKEVLDDDHPTEEARPRTKKPSKIMIS
jgi:hypothetical protein